MSALSECPSCDHSLDDHSPKRGCSKCLCDVKPDGPVRPRQDPGDSIPAMPGSVQGAVLALAVEAEGWGVTWTDVARSLGMHHGQATAALSRLHEKGDLARLPDDRRDHCSIYVTPDHAAGRVTIPQGWRGLRLNPKEVEALQLVLDTDCQNSRALKVVEDALGRALA